MKNVKKKLFSGDFSLISKLLFFNAVITPNNFRGWLYKKLQRNAVKFATVTKSNVGQNEKKILGFLIPSKNAFLWSFSLSTNPEIVRSAIV